MDLNLSGKRGPVAGDSKKKALNRPHSLPTFLLGGTCKVRFVTSSRPGRIEESPGWYPSSGVGLDSQSVVHGNPQLLLASEVTLRRLD